jgi:hypothetical protein
MDLQEINVGSFETSKGGIDGIEDRLTGETALVDVLLEGSEMGLEIALLRRMVADEAEAFGEDEDLVAWNAVLCNRSVRIPMKGAEDLPYR